MDLLKETSLLVINQSRTDNFEMLIGKQYAEAISWGKYLKKVIFICYSSTNNYLYKKISYNVYLIGVPFDLSISIIKSILNLGKNYIRLFRFLIWLMKKTKIDIMGMENVVISGPPVLLVSKLRKIPYIMWIVGNEQTVVNIKYKKTSLNSILKKMISLYLKIISKKASFILYYSKELMNLGKNQNIKRSLLTPNFVDIKKFRDIRPDPDVSLSHKKRKIILFVGRFSEEKGIKTLLNSIKKISDEKDKFELYMVGDGYLKNWVKHFIKRNEIDNVKLLGLIPDEELIKVYNKAEIFVLPSYSEGAPASLLEAMSSGCASICSSVGECSTIINNGENGILIPPGDSEVLAKSIKNLINNNDLVEKFRKNGRLTIIKYAKNYEKIHKFIFKKTIRGK